MSLVANLPDVSALIRSLCDISLTLAMAGCVLIAIECIFVLCFPAQAADPTAAQPPVTVLKPLHGAEPGLAARLTAFCRQDYGAPVQVLCGTPNDVSPAATVVCGMKDASADASIELYADQRSHGFNRKVSNLINILPHARYDTLVLSDSDIVVEPDYLRGVTALLASPRAGAVTCLYHGVGGKRLWTQLSALAINAHFLPQAILAVSLGLAKPCCGATIALRRSTLDRIGGFGALADMLADDHGIGLAVRAAGYEVVTAPFLVGHCCFENNLRQLVLHQLRIARTIRSIDPVGYAGTIVTHPWPLALLAMMTGGSAAATIAIAVLAARLALCRCVEWRFGLARQNYWLVPIHDLIAFGIYVASFFGAKVHWRGFDYRVTADGALIEDET